MVVVLKFAVCWWNLLIADWLFRLTATNQKLVKSEKEVESMTSLYNTAKQQTSEVQVSCY